MCGSKKEAVLRFLFPRVNESWSWNTLFSQIIQIFCGERRDRDNNKKGLYVLSRMWKRMNRKNQQQLQKYGVINFQTATHCSYQWFASNMKSHNLTSSYQSFFLCLPQWTLFYPFVNNIALCYCNHDMVWSSLDHYCIITISIPSFFIPRYFFPFLYHIFLFHPFRYEYNFEQDT